MTLNAHQKCLCVFPVVEKFLKGSLGKEGRRFVEAVEATSYGSGRGDPLGMLNDLRIPCASQNMPVHEHHCEYGRVCRWVRGVESPGTCA